jgi:hypothetical protein
VWQERRTFELQLMPAMCAFFEEGIAYYTPPTDDAESEPDCRISHWDWSTVAVFTCSKVRSSAMHAKRRPPPTRSQLSRTCKTSGPKWSGFGCAQSCMSPAHAASNSYSVEQVCMSE